MNKIVHYIGLDVHKDSIAVAVAPPDPRRIAELSTPPPTMNPNNLAV
jgi:hypothetical protein